MSKSLRSMTGHEQQAAISRRLASSTKGLGYWAAHDARQRSAYKLWSSLDNAVKAILAPYNPR